MGGGKFREALPIVAGAVMTGIALTAASRRIETVEKELQSRSNPVEVVVAASPIAAGDAFREANLARKSIPASGTGVRNVPASEFELLMGGRSRNPIEAGEPVLWTDVEEPFDTEPFSRGITPGRRAMTIGVDASSSFAGLLHPGDRVDLLCEQDGKGNGAVPLWIRDLAVAAVDRNRNRLGKPVDSPDIATVTLMVTPSEGARVASSAVSGKLYWFLRNPDDNSVVSASSKDGQRISRRVEIWKGGLPEYRQPPNRDAAQ